MENLTPLVRLLYTYFSRPRTELNIAVWEIMTGRAFDPVNIKYFTLAQLKLAVRIGEKRDYNRQLDPDFVRNLPDVTYPIVFAMPHHHIAGKPAEEHMRCRVIYNADGDAFMLDVAAEVWDALDSVPMPDETPKEETLTNGR
jgi:hypothetical protein